jgi:hypothetical protein
MKSSSNKVKPTDRVWGYSREQLMKEVELLRDEVDRERATKEALIKRLLPFQDRIYWPLELEDEVAGKDNP